MTSNDSVEMKAVVEGAEPIVNAFGEHLRSIGIESTISMAEDCRPGG